MLSSSIERKTRGLRLGVAKKLRDRGVPCRCERTRNGSVVASTRKLAAIVAFEAGDGRAGCKRSPLWSETEAMPVDTFVD